MDIKTSNQMHEMTCVSGQMPLAIWIYFFCLGEKMMTNTMHEISSKICFVENVVTLKIFTAKI